MRGACHKQSGNRKIEVNKQLIKYKQQTRENLLSEKGRELRGRRCAEVEQTFGQIKWNKKFNRFLLRGLPKVSIEIGLIAIAHNLQKLAMLLSSDKIPGFYTQSLQFLKRLWGNLCVIFRHVLVKTDYLTILLIDKNYSLKKI